MSSTRFFIAALSLFVLIAGLSAYAWFASGGQPIPLPEVVASIEQGSAELYRNGATSTVGAAATLIPGDELVTGSESILALSRAGVAHAFFDEGSRVKILFASTTPGSYGDAQIALGLERGRAYIVWGGSSSPTRFVAETYEGRIAGSRGNRARAVIQAADTGTRVTVLSGSPVKIFRASRNPDVPDLVPITDLEVGETLGIARLTRAVSPVTHAAKFSDAFFEIVPRLIQKAETADRDVLRENLIELVGGKSLSGPGFWLKRFGEEVRAALITNRTARLAFRLVLVQRRFAESLLYRGNLERIQHAQEAVSRELNGVSSSTVRDHFAALVNGWDAETGGERAYFEHRLGVSGSASPEETSRDHYSTFDLIPLLALPPAPAFPASNTQSAVTSTPLTSTNLTPESPVVP